MDRRWREMAGVAMKSDRDPSLGEEGPAQALPEIRVLT